MREIAIVALFLSTAICPAQDKQPPRGNLIGVVTDPTGAIVPGVKVTATRVMADGAAETKSTLTNHDGQFLFPLVAPGFYRLHLEKPGFVSVEVRETEVAKKSLASVRIGLRLGDSRDTDTRDSNSVQISEADYQLTARFYESVPLESHINVLVYRPGVSDPNAPKTPSDKRFIIKDLDGIPHGRSVGDIIEMY